MRTLIIGIGNPLRGDDGIGPAIIEALEVRGLGQHATLVAAHQLLPEHASLAAGHDAVIFVDASVALKPGEIDVTRVTPPANTEAFCSHHLTPEWLMHAAAALYGATCDAVLITLGGQAWDQAELSKPASAAVDAIQEKLFEWTAADLPPSPELWRARLPQSTKSR